MSLLFFYSYLKSSFVRHMKIKNLCSFLFYIIDINYIFGLLVILLFACFLKGLINKMNKKESLIHNLRIGLSEFFTLYQCKSRLNLYSKIYLNSTFIKSQ